MPPPEMAKAYEEICKGTFERILTMAEQEAVARRRLTETDHDEYNRSVKCGMRLAFVLTLAAFAGAIACAALGCEKAAMVFVGATVVNLAAVYGMDVLLTWNCKHMANPVTLPKTSAVIVKNGFDCPIIITPEEFLARKEELAL